MPSNQADLLDWTNVENMYITPRDIYYDYFSRDISNEKVMDKDYDDSVKNWDGPKTIDFSKEHFMQETDVRHRKQARGTAQQMMFNFLA